MNEDKPVRTLEITDGALKMWESVHDMRTDAGRAAIEAGLAEFDRHKKSFSTICAKCMSAA